MNLFKQHFIGTIAIILLLLSAISCTPGSCYEQTETYLNAAFYNIEKEQILAPGSLTIYGLNEDSLIYNEKTKISLAQLPLNPADDACSFIMIINGIQDTLKFTYSSFPHLISKECGYSFFHTLEADPEFTNNAISHIIIVNNNITTLNEANITIYY